MNRKLRKTIEVYLTHEEIFQIVREYARKNPEVVKVLLEHPIGSCPFLDDCKYFPCKTLDCNNDVLNNGYPIRWS